MSDDDAKARSAGRVIFALSPRCRALVAQKLAQSRHFERHERANGQWDDDGAGARSEQCGYLMRHFMSER
jgi:hypothetical protein